MKEYWEKLCKILEGTPGAKRNKKLASLMTELERTFEIPMISDDNFNNAHDGIMDLYLTVSSMRDSELRLSNEKETNDFLIELEAQGKIVEDCAMKYLLRDKLIAPLEDEEIKSIYNISFDYAKGLNKPLYISEEQLKDYMESQRVNYTLGKHEENFYNFISNDIKHGIDISVII